ncbi:MAG: hypothetical protein AMXMBFR23_01680 [Chloroflexota bacterium]
MVERLDEIGSLLLMLLLLAVAATLTRGQRAMRRPEFAPPSEAAADLFTRELAEIARGVWVRRHTEEASDAS